MNPGTKDQLEGKLHEVKGGVKEAVGDAVNNPNLEAEGAVEKVTGKVQNKLGRLEKALEK